MTVRSVEPFTVYHTMYFKALPYIIALMLYVLKIIYNWKLSLSHYKYESTGQFKLFDYAKEMNAFALRA